MVLKGVRLPKDGKTMVHLRPLSMISLQASKSHSSKEPKSEPFPHATSSGHGSATHTMPVHTETASPHTPKFQMTSTQPIQPSSQADMLSTLIKVCINIFLDLKRFSTPLTIKSKCASQPLRHN